MAVAVVKSRQTQIATVFALLIAGITLRLLPHPANFAPIGAIAIFSGALLPRKVSPWVPLAIMVVSDAIIGFYALAPLVWSCYVAIALASSYWLKRPTVLKGATLSITSSVFFFVVTNFGVWLTSGMYTHTWAGLVSCYDLALPFFRNTIASDAFYTGVLFGMYELLRLASEYRVKVLINRNRSLANQ